MQDARRVTVKVEGYLDEMGIQEVVRVVQEHLGAGWHVRIERPGPVLYAEFRKFYLAHPDTKSDNQGYGRAARSWRQLLRLIPEVPACCVSCGQLRGECRCPSEGYGDLTDRWFYYDHDSNWAVDRAALRAITPEQLQRLKPQTAQHLEKFVASLR
jgi:hypothetical protein